LKDEFAPFSPNRNRVSKKSLKSTQRTKKKTAQATVTSQSLKRKPNEKPKKQQPHITQSKNLNVGKEQDPRGEDDLFESSFDDEYTTKKRTSLSCSQPTKTHNSDVTPKYFSQPRNNTVTKKSKVTQGIKPIDRQQDRQYQEEEEEEEDEEKQEEKDDLDEEFNAANSPPIVNDDDIDDEFGDREALNPNPKIDSTDAKKKKKRKQSPNSFPTEQWFNNKFKKMYDTLQDINDRLDNYGKFQNQT